ncbi:YegP family protein [Chitinophaga alhagiae]|uniref:YegP family protein n=1 Tax=Chitinophaga alhagiae TaxID=2203219 RepID=UPI000E5A651D|nr:YegP family protein [Chitinophaga alhagiae]
MGKFVVTKRSNGEFQFNLKADNGETILSSEGYSAKAGCENGIESVRKHSQSDANYDKKTSSNGKYFFNLKASNGQVIGTSEMYESASGRDGGIESVKKNAPGASVVDDSSKAA